MGRGWISDPICPSWSYPGRMTPSRLEKRGMLRERVHTVGSGDKRPGRGVTSTGSGIKPWRLSEDRLQVPGQKSGTCRGLFYNPDRKVGRGKISLRVPDVEWKHRRNRETGVNVGVCVETSARTKVRYRPGTTSSRVYEIHWGSISVPVWLYSVKTTWTSVTGRLPVTDLRVPVVSNTDPILSIS